MTLREIEDLIIALLAEEAGREPADLRAELESLDEELPIDSQLAAEVLARVEVQCGVRLPATAENAKALRSVSAFARAILDLVYQQGASGAVTA
jgi:acyl carrier protein